MSMNIHMKTVKVTLKGKNPVPMDHLTIRGSTIRYVLLPVCRLFASTSRIFRIISPWTRC